MNHPGEERLLAYHYGEDPAPGALAAHLAECPDCRSLLDDLRATLRWAERLEVPERGSDYPDVLWERIRTRLSPDQTVPPRRVRPASRWAAGLAAAAALVLAFLVGRRWPASPGPSEVGPSVVATRVPALPAPGGPSARGLWLALGRHAERSQVLLVELLHGGGASLAARRTWNAGAQELLADNRLYRRAAAERGELWLAHALAELEPALLEIAAQDMIASPAALHTLRERLRGADVLFKVRVLRRSVHARQRPLAVRRANRRS